MLQALFWLTLTVGGTVGLILWDPAHRHPKYHQHKEES